MTKVWWLLLFGWNSTPATVIPVPYHSEEACQAAAKAAEDATRTYACVEQPASDVSAWLRSHGGGNAVGY